MSDPSRVPHPLLAVLSAAAEGRFPPGSTVVFWHPGGSPAVFAPGGAPQTDALMEV